MRHAAPSLSISWCPHVGLHDARTVRADVDGVPRLTLLLGASAQCGLESTAAKYQLHTESQTSARSIAPKPRIPGVLRKAELSNFLQGEINGVPVVAFDIRSGTFHLRPQSSAVGMQRLHLNIPHPRDFVTTEQDGWTFPYQDRLFRSPRPLKALRIEELWTTLLHAAGSAAILPNACGSDASGGIVIRPTKLVRN